MVQIHFLIKKMSRITWIENQLLKIVYNSEKYFSLKQFLESLNNESLLIWAYYTSKTLASLIDEQSRIKYLIIVVKRFPKHNILNFK